MFLLPVPLIGMGAVGYDADAQAWFDEVVNNGGTVSNGRKTVVNELVVGLKNDGIWSKLDRLSLYAAENTPSALTDLVSLTLATEVNSVTFAADQGYTPAGNGTYIDTNFNPTSGSPNFAQDSAMLAVWNNSNVEHNSALILNSGFSCLIGTRLTTGLDDCYVDVNSASGFSNTTTNANGDGLWAADRSGASAILGYRNGSQVITGSSSSASPANQNLVIQPVNRQISVVVIGEHLTGAEHSDLYDRLSIYRTAVGL